MTFCLTPYELNQLKHLPRYLKAIQLRLTRLEHDPNKDARKAESIIPLWQNYWQGYSDGKIIPDMNALVFKVFVEHILVPVLYSNNVVILDNAKVHYDEKAI